MYINNPGLVKARFNPVRKCPSAKENVCVTDILYEIIEKETYKKRL